jgi:hypothetical protein
MPPTDRGPGRPDADECLPYYFQYIRLVPDGHILDTLEHQITESAAFLGSFTPQQALRRAAPGEWNPLEIVGHVADTERVFGYRALRIARADPVMWTVVEFPDYAAAANFGARPLGDVVAELTAVRAAFVAFLRGLDAAGLAAPRPTGLDHPQRARDRLRHGRPRAPSPGRHPPAARRKTRARANNGLTIHGAAYQL